MTIKEVEKLTGLTAKSIRYYEDKGLLVVERNAENDYRSYSETEVNRLRKIKLLRYLEFNVEEVKLMLDLEPNEQEKVLREKAEEYEDIRERYKDKREICLSLAKDYKKDEETLSKVVSEYNEFICNIDSDEMKESMEELKYLSTPSFSMTLLYTFLFSGPIMALFINISDGKWENLTLVAGLAILSTALVTGWWIFYFVQRCKHKNRVKKKNRAQSWMFPILIGTLILGLVLISRIMLFIENTFMPQDFLFYSYPEWATRGMMWMVMGSIVLIGSVVWVKLFAKSKEQMEDDSIVFWLWNFLGKWKFAGIGVILVFFYICVMNFTVVTENSIICHSAICPRGEKYSYLDIEEIVAGVGQETFAFEEYKRKGSFYYQIKLDGKTITFTTADSSNGEIERYAKHTYLWFEEFDQKLVNLGIPKQSDSTGYENIGLDQEYVDRFLRILENN